MCVCVCVCVGGGGGWRTYIGPYYVNCNGEPVRLSLILFFKLMGYPIPAFPYLHLQFLICLFNPAVSHYFRVEFGQLARRTRLS